MAKPVQSMTDREVAAALEHLAGILARGGIERPDSRGRAAAVVRGAARRLTAPAGGSVSEASDGGSKSG